MVRKLSQKKIQSLQIVYPNLYRWIVEELEEKFCIHSYDIQADAIQKENGVEVIIRFGQYFHHQKKEFLSNPIERSSEEFNKFIHKIGKACREVLIDDYFKMMTP